MSTIVLFVLLVFALSSIWLYSPGPSKVRDWWIDPKNTSFLSPLGYCQLCCGFWFALATEWMFIDDLGWIVYITLSLIASVISWALGAFTMACLYIKAYYEIQVGLLCQELKSQSVEKQ